MTPNEIHRTIDILEMVPEAEVLGLDSVLNAESNDIFRIWKFEVPKKSGHVRPCPDVQTKTLETLQKC